MTNFYDQVVSAHQPAFIPVLGFAGVSPVAALKGSSGFAFPDRIGRLSPSFWGWRRVVDAFGPNPKQRKPLFFVIRLLAGSCRPAL